MGSCDVCGPFVFVVVSIIECTFLIWNGVVMIEGGTVDLFDSFLDGEVK